MSTNASQSNARYSHRASVRAMWVIAALLAVSYAGDEHLVRPFVSGQDSAAQDDLLSAPADAAAETPPVTAEVTAPAESSAASSVGSDTADAAGTTAPVAGKSLSGFELDDLPATADASDVAPAKTKATIRKKEPIEKALTQKGNLIMRDVSLADVMTILSEDWNVDINFDPTELQSFIGVWKYTDATLEFILKEVLTPKGFGYKVVGNGLAIMKQSEIGEVKLNQIQEIITLEYNEPEAIEPQLRFIKSPAGITSSMPSLKALMVIDTPENVENIKKHINKIEQIARNVAERKQAEIDRQQAAAAAANQSAASQADPTQSLPTLEPVTHSFYRPRFIQASDTYEALGAQLAELKVTASALEAENVILLAGPRSALETATQLLRGLDVPRRQARITVKMYDVSLDALEALGFNWRNAGKDQIQSNGVPRGLFDVNSAPVQFGSSASTTSTSGSSSTSSSTSATASTGTTGATTTTTPFGGYIASATPNIVGGVVTIYNVTKHFDISAVIQAINQTAGARLLADPSVTVIDRESSTIEIITEIPVQQLTQTDMGGSIGTTTSRQAGITLTVLPEIADDQWMQLTVTPEFSALQGYQNGQPIIDRRRESTKVLLQNGDTLTLGGLRSKTENETVSGVPGLMNIKYIGNLFRSHQTNIAESELIIFIHAEILPAGCSMRPREQIASQVLDETLEQIPYATHAPFIPPCNDPYCPYHNPSPRLPNSGPVPGEWSEENGPPLPPTDQGAKKYPAPLHGRPGHNMLQPAQTPASPADPDSSQADSTAEHADPPPVLVDPSALRQRHSTQQNQMAMRRLPSVTSDGPNANAVAQENPAGKAKGNATRGKLPAGNDPKSRLARAGKRPTTIPPTTAPSDKKITLPSSILR